MRLPGQVLTALEQTGMSWAVENGRKHHKLRVGGRPATDMSDAATFEDCFNLLCGKKLGQGAHRTVYECKLRPDLVVKVENGDFRRFANILEAQFWGDNQYCDKVARWLAPVEFLSPDGRLLLMRRAEPVNTIALPDQLPTFLTDLKAENFGILDGRLVCIDYALTITTASTRLRKASWG